MTKCRTCSNETIEHEHLCMECTPFVPFKLTPTEISDLERAAGIRSEKLEAHELASQMRIKFEQKLQQFNSKNVKDLANSLFELRFGFKFEHDIASLRCKPNSPVDSSFSVPHWGNGSCGILIQMGILSGFPRYVDTSIWLDISDNFISFPLICDFKFSIGDGNISQKLIQSIEGFYAYNLSIVWLNLEYDYLFENYVDVNLVKYIERAFNYKFLQNRSIRKLADEMDFVNKKLDELFSTIQNEIESIIEKTDYEQYIELLRAKSKLANNGDAFWIRLRQPSNLWFEPRLRFLF